MKIIKIALILAIVLMLFSGVYVYLNRAILFNRSINSLIENLMPPYMEAGEIDFDFDKSLITITDFKILNPDNFEHPYLLEIPLIKSSYSQSDKSNMLKGVDLKDINLINPVLCIDRRQDAEISIQHMEEVFSRKKPVKRSEFKSAILSFFSYILSPVKRLNQLFRLESVFDITGGKFIFTDMLIEDTGYITTIDSIEADVKLDMNKNYRQINYVETSGSGLVNGGGSQQLQWVTEYDPQREKLTMLNTFKIRNVDFVHFAPYYGKFSPFNFTKGRASGEMVFNFDNGDIGSTNELRLSNLEFTSKKDHSFNKFWPTGSEDLYRYFSSASGDVVFDFKIKGPMENPKFYLGPKTKRALTRMVVSKVAEALFKKKEDPGTESQGESPPPQDEPQEEKSDVEKVFDILSNL